MKTRLITGKPSRFLSYPAATFVGSRGPKGNPVGSREAFTLSVRCREIVVGTILGDGCLERNGANVRLRIDHGATQKAFVEWKLHELKELHPLQPRLVQRLDRRTRRVHENYRFDTRTTPRLNHYFDLFYGGTRIKRIPMGIFAVLRTPLSLAVWYMDDGSKRRDCRSGYLNTNAYSVKDVQLLKECLWFNFGVESVTHFAAAKPRIYIPSRGFGRFCSLVAPFVIPTMRYKLL